MTLQPVSRLVANDAQTGMTGQIVSVKSSVKRSVDAAVTDIVDSFRGLRGSIEQFLLMLNENALPDAGAAGSSASFDDLLSQLVQQAQALGFTQLNELVATSNSARAIAWRKDIIFEDLTRREVAMLQRIAEEIRALNVRFVGLCVGSVLERYRNQIS